MVKSTINGVNKMNIKKIDTKILTTTAIIAIAFAGSGCDNEEPTSTCCPSPKSETVASEPVKLEPVSAPVPVKELSKVVVTVNGKELLRTEMMKELDMFASSPQFASMPPEQAAMIRQQMEGRLVDRFVNQTVLIAAADKDGITVEDSEVDKTIEEIKGTLPPNVTMEQIMEQRGMKMDEFRKNIASDLRIRTLIEKQTEGITNATDEAVAAFYAENKEQFNTPESVQARHILVKFEKDADEATKAAKKIEIEGYRKQITDGTNDFATVAAAHSACPSGQKGGDLGSFGRGQMVPAFEKAAFEQEIDAVGAVIETQFGYHIVQVIKRTDAGERTLEDVKEELKEQLLNRSKQEAVEVYITKLRDSAEIINGDK